MKRVVITGAGLITPIGAGREEFWRNLVAGQSGIAPVRSFDTSDYPVHIGAEVKEFDPARWVRNRDPDSMGRGSQLAIAAARMALDDAGLSLSAFAPRRVGISMGTTSGEPGFVEKYNDIRKAEGLDALPGDLGAKYPCNVIPSNVAIELGLQGPCLMIPTACAAGNYAIGYGFDLIRTGRADLMLAGGADPFSRITYTGFARLGAIAPERCQPFDRNRKGMVPGEGAAVLVLEPLEAALARGARIYAEVLGYGLSGDAWHITAPSEDGEGGERSMRAALKRAGLEPSAIDYVNAHGTSTMADTIELAAVERMMGNAAAKATMSSTKSSIGHLLGAAGAVEAIFCVLAIRDQIAPPTINLDNPAVQPVLDLAANRAVRREINVALSNSFGFGGTNASLVLGRV